MQTEASALRYSKLNSKSHRSAGSSKRERQTYSNPIHWPHGTLQNLHRQN